jgi:hypothetical protein
VASNLLQIGHRFISGLDSLLLGKRQVAPTDRWIAKLVKLVPLEASVCFSTAVLWVKASQWILLLLIFSFLLAGSVWYLVRKRGVADKYQIITMSIAFTVFALWLSKSHLIFAFSTDHFFEIADFINDGRNFDAILITVISSLFLLAPQIVDQLHKVFENKIENEVCDSENR